MAEVVNGLVTNPPYLQLYQVNAEKLEFIEVTSDDQTSGYFKTRDTGEWFIRGETLETSLLVFAEEWGDTPAFISGPRVDRVVAESFDDPGIYGLDPPQTSVRLAVRDEGVTEFQLGSLTDDGNYRYTRLSGEPRLFAMREQLAQRISDLASDPPYPPGYP